MNVDFHAKLLIFESIVSVNSQLNHFCLQDPGIHKEPHSKPHTTLIEAEIWDLEQVSKFYTNEYSHKTWYQPPQETEEGNIRVPFPDPNTALAFGEAIAKKGLSLMIVDDATGAVLAYSYGDGVLNPNKEQRTLDDIQSDILAHKHPSP